MATPTLDKARVERQTVEPEERQDQQESVHQLGRGWVWGAGRGIVTVRFETADTSPGPVWSLPADDSALSPWSPPEA